MPPKMLTETEKMFSGNCTGRYSPKKRTAKKAHNPMAALMHSPFIVALHFCSPRRINTSPESIKKVKIVSSIVFTHPKCILVHSVNMLKFCRLPYFTFIFIWIAV